MDGSEKVQNYADVIYGWSLIKNLKGLTQAGAVNSQEFQSKLNYHTAHCCSIRSNLKKMGPLQICLPVFLGIHKNPKQKDFFYFARGIFEIILFIHFYLLG